MKNYLSNWNFRRIIYLIGGIFFVLVAINDRTWWMIPFGLYFISMAVFRFGCAATSKIRKNQRKRKHRAKANDEQDLESA